MNKQTQIQRLAVELIKGTVINADIARKVADVHEMPRKFRKLVEIAAAHGVFIKGQERPKKNGGTFKVWSLKAADRKKLAKVVGL